MPASRNHPNVHARVSLYVESMCTSRFMYCGRKAYFTTGNVIPLSEIPGGTKLCNAEAKKGDRGMHDRAIGDDATDISHLEGNKTHVRLCGSRKIVPGTCRPMAGIVADVEERISHSRRLVLHITSTGSKATSDQSFVLLQWCEMGGAGHECRIERDLGEVGGT